VGNIGFRSAQREFFSFLHFLACCWLSIISYSSVAQRLDCCQCRKSERENSAGLLHRNLRAVRRPQCRFPGSPVLVCLIRVL
jgi:hypothetical protein